MSTFFQNKKDLPYYIRCFIKLRRDYKNGGAPHKPILLLSIIDLFEKQELSTNEIPVLPELVAAFKRYWSTLVETNHTAIFALPFYHMNSEPFWKLLANPGCEMWVQSKSSMRNFNNLNTAIAYALIDKELTAFLKEPTSRDVLKVLILDTYFPNTKSNLKPFTDTDEDKSFLSEDSETYKKKIETLRQQLDDNAFQEEVFVRCGIFKREVPKIYNNTCAISRMQVTATSNASMIDACHIVPFSESYDDTITNGIALCPNLHRAFDRGLIAISDDYRVMVNNNFVENSESAYNLRQFKGLEILLPDNNKFHPSRENLSWHKRKYFGDCSANRTK